jgi:hypothetical protein
MSTSNRVIKPNIFKTHNKKNILNIFINNFINIRRKKKHISFQEICTKSKNKENITAKN